MNYAIFGWQQFSPWSGGSRSGVQGHLPIDLSNFTLFSCDLPMIAAAVFRNKSDILKRPFGHRPPWLLLPVAAREKEKSVATTVTNAATVITVNGTVGLHVKTPG